MGNILSQLEQLLVQSLPTVVLVFILLVMLSRLFFKPLTEVLKDRQEATTGALERARLETATGEAKSRQYEEAFQAARQDVYRLREAERQQALLEREQALQKAREQSEAWLKEALAGISAEVEGAQRELAAVFQPLAAEIKEAVLGDGSPGLPSGRQGAGS